MNETRSIRQGLFLPLLLLAAACTTLGPDYEEPEVAWLSDWQTDLYGQIDNTDQQNRLDLRFWWQLFDDPTLNQLIAVARRDNPTMHIAGLRILESRAALGIAGSTRYPQLQQIGATVTGVNSDKSGGIVEDRSQSLTAYQTDFRVGWELDFWGRFQRSIESADAVFLASITSHHDLQVLLSAQVAELYFNYLTIAQRIEIARNNAARQERSFTITQKLFTAGQGSELDLQQAKTQQLATLSTIPELESALIQVRNALSVLLGRPPGEIAELAGMVQALPDTAALSISEIPAQLLLRRPDIRSAAWQVAAQSAQIGVAKADYYPAISLFGSIGWSGDSLSATADTTQLAVGPSLTWNVFDYGRIRNNVRLQDARLQQAIESFQNSVLLAAREIDDAAIKVVKTAEQEIILKQALQAAERSLELASTRYQEGYADFQRVLDAQRALFSQADRYLVVRGAHLNAITQLYKAFGGGWVDMPIDTLIPESTRQQMRERTKWGGLLDAQLPAPDAGPDAELPTPR